ncbi:SH2 domain-containing protein [Nephila pilipes]|uniref:SH2 domain-containing protein n=1 Tax=Nephila pilipes TaxID=299642 RepID=A0A8X6UIU3_NEPPI|nr:SH2 domain-containing protein [Nephila pilipes]
MSYFTEFGNPQSNHESENEDDDWGSDFEESETQLCSQEIQDNLINEGREDLLRKTNKTSTKDFPHINTLPADTSQSASIMTRNSTTEARKTGAVPKLGFSYLSNINNTNNFENSRTNVRNVENDIHQNAVSFPSTNPNFRVSNQSQNFSRRHAAKLVCANKETQQANQQRIQTSTNEALMNKAPQKLKPEAFSFLGKISSVSNESNIPQENETNKKKERKHLVPTAFVHAERLRDSLSLDETAISTQSNFNESVDFATNELPLGNRSNNYEPFGEESIPEVLNVTREVVKPPLPTRPPPVLKYPPGTFSYSRSISLESAARSTVLHPSSQCVRTKFAHPNSSPVSKLTDTNLTKESNSVSKNIISLQKRSAVATAIPQDIVSRPLPPLPVSDEEITEDTVPCSGMNQYENTVSLRNDNRSNEIPVAKVNAPYNIPIAKANAPYEIPIEKSSIPYEIPIEKSSVPCEIPVAKSIAPYETPIENFSIPYEIPISKSRAPYETPIAKISTPLPRPITVSSIYPTDELNRIELIAEDSFNEEITVQEQSILTPQQRLAQIIGNQSNVSTEVLLSQSKITSAIAARSQNSTGQAIPKAKVAKSNEIYDFGTNDGNNISNIPKSRRSLESKVEPQHEEKPERKQTNPEISERENSRRFTDQETLLKAMSRPMLPQKAIPMQRSVSCNSLVQSIKELSFSVWNKPEKNKRNSDGHYLPKKSSKSISPVTSGKAISPKASSITLVSITSNAAFLDGKNNAPPTNEKRTLLQYPWYHDIDSKEAQNRLLSVGENGAYLVRPSTVITDEIKNTLCILYDWKIRNMYIRRKVEDDRYSLGSRKLFEQTFPSVPDLIEYHQKVPIEIKPFGGAASNQPIINVLLRETPPKSR